MSLRLNCNAAPFVSKLNSPIDRAPGSCRPVSRPMSLELGPFSFGSNLESSFASSFAYESACESACESSFATPLIRTELEYKMLYPELAKAIFGREFDPICNVNDWWYNNKTLFDDSYEDLKKIFLWSKIPIKKDLKKGELKPLNVEKIKPSKCVNISLTPIVERPRSYASVALKEYLRTGTGSK